MFQQKERQPQLEIKTLQQRRPQRLQEQERQLQFDDQRVQKELILEATEVEEDAGRGKTEAKITRLRLTDVLPQSNGS